MNSNGLHRAIKLYREFFGEEPEKVVSVPGRLDFLNTHQDYKGLPVVSVGINLRCYTAISKESGANATVVSFNLMEEGLDYKDSFDIRDLGSITREKFSSYLKAAVKVLVDKGHRISGFKVGIYSEIPIASGMASSAALTTSFIGALNSLFELGLSKKDIAEYAYIAEHDVLGIPCGRLDQYGCVFGGVALINTRPPYNVEDLPVPSGVFVVADSGVRHRTADIHPRRQDEINQGLRYLMNKDLPEELRRKLGYNYWEPKWDKLSLEELSSFLEDIPETPRKRIVFTLKMHKSTIEALKALRGEKTDTDFISEVVESVRRFTGGEPSTGSREEVVGAIMTYQHILLRDYYDVSLPILDNLVISAVRGGAYGAKLSGAGLGGVVIALVKDRDLAEKIASEAIKAGAKRSWIVGIDKGITVH